MKNNNINEPRNRKKRLCPVNNGVTNGKGIQENKIKNLFENGHSLLCLGFLYFARAFLM
jgi:hypothetical protein